MRRIKVYTLPIITDVQKGPVLEARRLVFPSGEMAQIVNGESMPYIAYVEFPHSNQPQPRGNHYHIKKHEYLYIAQGRLHGYFYDLMTGEQGECIVEKGDLVYHATSCAHAYIPLEHSHTIEIASHVYDVEDTIRYSFDTNQEYQSIEKILGFPFGHESMFVSNQSED